MMERKSSIFIFLLVICIIFIYNSTKITTEISTSPRFLSVLSRFRLSDITWPQTQGDGMLTESGGGYKEVRIACLVITMPANHAGRAKMVKQTWAKRCHKYFFVSTKADDSLGTVVTINQNESRGILWEKTRAGFTYAWNHFKDEVDWFMKADDDTYVVVENLQYLLSAYSPDDPIWFGYRFNKFAPRGYMSGGGGYVLSREATRRFVMEALPNKTLCFFPGTPPEDVAVGKCLHNVSVVALDSRDEIGGERFHPFIPSEHLGDMRYLKWFVDYSYYPIRNGTACCSNTSITFHYVTPKDMQVIDFLIYYLKPARVSLQPLTKIPYIPKKNAELLSKMRNETKKTT